VNQAPALEDWASLVKSETPRSRTSSTETDVLGHYPFEIILLHKLHSFNVADSYGPWLRDRICITSDEAKTYSAGLSEKFHQKGVSHSLDALLRDTGFVSNAGVQEDAPVDEWNKIRQGVTLRDGGGLHPELSEKTSVDNAILY